MRFVWQCLGRRPHQYRPPDAQDAVPPDGPVTVHVGAPAVVQVLAGMPAAPHRDGPEPQEGCLGRARRRMGQILGARAVQQGAGDLLAAVTGGSALGGALAATQAARGQLVASDVAFMTAAGAGLAVAIRRVGTGNTVVNTPLVREAVSDARAAVLTAGSAGTLMAAGQATVGLPPDDPVVFIMAAIGAPTGIAIRRLGRCLKNISTPGEPEEA